MVESDDEQPWVTRSRNGDQVAFEALIKTHSTMIHSLTFCMTGSTAAAKALAPETFVRAVSTTKFLPRYGQITLW